MSRVVFDIEADNLLGSVTQIWCIVAKDIDSGVTRRYSPLDIDEAIRYLCSADVLIGHNIVTYDLPALWKVRGDWDHVPHVLDTLVLSRYLQPERKGGHSLAAWGERLGFPKGDFKDFDHYCEEMLEYCERDVLLNVKVLNKLEEEYGSTIEGFKVFS
jgi:DNA polymerase III alpha subunit (gram-positive type)